MFIQASLLIKFRTFKTKITLLINFLHKLSRKYKYFAWMSKTFPYIMLLLFVLFEICKRKPWIYRLWKWKNISIDKMYVLSILKEKVIQQNRILYWLFNFFCYLPDDWYFILYTSLNDFYISYLDLFLYFIDLDIFLFVLLRLCYTKLLQNLYIFPIMTFLMPDLIFHLSNFFIPIPKIIY